MCLLSGENYAEDKPLSQAIIKGMADLSKLVSADEGQKLLTYEIECRSRGGTGGGKRSYLPDLIVSDVKEAIKKVKTKQLEGVTQTISKSQAKRMLESTPNQTSDETSNPTQQDHLNKKQRLGLQSPIGRVVNELDIEPLNQPDRMMEEGSIGLLSESSTDHRKEEVLGQEFREEDYLNNSATHQYEDDLPDQSLLGPHQDVLEHQQDKEKVIDGPNTPTLSVEEITLCGEELATEPADYSTILESFEDITALATLEPEQLVSSEIIFRVLQACAPERCFVVDRLFMDPTFKSPSSPRRVRKSMPEDISTVIVPLHHNKQSHWTVVIFERHRTFAQHLDSFPSLKSTIDERYFQQCMKELDKDYEDKDKDIFAGRCPVQSNEYDCGVHVLANALYDMAGIEVPLAHDCPLWRRICRAIHSPSVDEASEDNKPLDMSAYSAELIWKKAWLGSPGTRHHAVEKGLDTLQSERRRNRAEWEEIMGMERLLNNLMTSSDDTRSRLDAEIRGMRENSESLYTQLEGAKEKEKEKEKSSSSSSSSSSSAPLPVMHKNHTTLPHRRRHRPTNPPPRQHTPLSALESHLHDTRNPQPRRRPDDIRRNSSSAHTHPHQGLALLAAQRILARSRERCAR